MADKLREAKKLTAAKLNSDLAPGRYHDGGNLGLFRSGRFVNSQSSSLFRQTDKAVNLFGAVQKGEIAIVKVVQPDFDDGTPSMEFCRFVLHG